MMMFSGSMLFLLSLSEDERWLPCSVWVVREFRILFSDLEPLSISGFDFEDPASGWSK